ncbi:hypothetical protein BDF22DRAFT_746241 [Syncephalis plumigaleata]|nr:hypothetical protein BDF22DRAFT_746241 [Syncephalis plumigaleata]
MARSLEELGQTYKGSKELQEKLGQTGTPASDIIKYMGKPDALDQTKPGTLTASDGVEQQPRAHMMPGPVVPGGATTAQQATDSGSLYFVYFWRGRHDCSGSKWIVNKTS